MDGLCGSACGSGRKRCAVGGVWPELWCLKRLNCREAGGQGAVLPFAALPYRARLRAGSVAAGQWLATAAELVLTTPPRPA